MAAPTQALPSYLSYSTQVITQPGGGVVTSTSLVELPLTYYGPSIPLGTDGVWTYGGLTRPASSRTASTQTATTSATPSSSTSIVSSTSSSTSATPSSVSSSPTSSSPTSSSPTSSLPTSSSSQVQSTSTSTVYATSSSASVPSSSSSLNKGALIGIILGSILGTLLLLLLALLFLRWRRRRQDAGYQTPIWTGWEIVDPTPAESQDNGHTHDADRPLGEGSPRGSGEEADSFLRRSGTTEGGTTPMADTSTRLASVPPAAAAGARAGAGAAGSGSNSGTNNSGGSGAARTESTAVSDYGILLHGSDYTNDPEGFFTQGPARPSTDMSHSDNPRRIIPPSELLRIERERDEQEQLMRNIPSTSRAMATVPEHYSPLSPPPPLDPDRTSRASPPPKASSSAISAGSANEQDDPMVLTARRVRLSQLGPRSQPELRSESTRGSSSAGVWGSLGLGGLARLSRLSWFKNLKDNLEDPYTSPRSRHGSRPSSWVARPLSEHDIEVGRALLDDEFKLSRPVGVTDEGERPMSSVSAKSAVSGNTIYHDAESVAGTPPPLPTLPRAYMSSGPTGHTQSHGGTEPPLYESEQTTKDNDHAPRLVDVLDMPAPASVSQFSSASSRSVQFPPGLMMLPSQPSWYGNSSDAETSGITIDVLEDTPPRPGDGWRAIARNATLSHPDHRTSFGMPQFGHTHDLTAISEVGSLHSMRSHLSPPSRSSGSAPASSRHYPTGSNSSRPSAYSHSRTASSGNSLAHSTSISFNEQRRTGGAVSPTLSAFGPDNSTRNRVPSPPPPPYMPRSLHAEPRKTVASVGSSITATGDTRTDIVGDIVADHSTGDSELLTMPWATGLD